MSASAEPEVSLQAAVDLFPFGVAYYRAGRYVWVNRALSEMIGRSPESLLTVDPFSLLAPEDEQRVRERFQARQRGEAPTAIYEIHVPRPDGSRATLELEARSVGPDAAILLYRNLSPHRRAQKLLEGLAQLAARVQRARSPEAVRSAALDGLFALGFQTTIAVVEPDGFACSWRVSDELHAVMQPALMKHLPFGRFRAARRMPAHARAGLHR